MRPIRNSIVASDKRLNTLISSKTIKVNFSLKLNDIQQCTDSFTTMIGFVTWPPYKTKRWPSDKANHSCKNTQL